MKRKKNTLFVICVILVLLLGSMLRPSWSVPTIAQTIFIEIEQRPPFFSPRAVSALVGTVIEWKNRTGEAHTIRADDCVRGGPCAFESRMIMPNGKFEVRGLRPGEYAYHCGIHPFMRGILTVRGQSPRVRSESI